MARRLFPAWHALIRRLCWRSRTRSSCAGRWIPQRSPRRRRAPRVSPVLRERTVFARSAVWLRSWLAWLIRYSAMPCPFGRRTSRQSGPFSTLLLPSSQGSSQIATVRAATTENSVGETPRSERVSPTISDGMTGQRSAASSLTGHCALVAPVGNARCRPLLWWAGYRSLRRRGCGRGPGQCPASPGPTRR
jgi:hypothetical protein